MQAFHDIVMLDAKQSSSAILLDLLHKHQIHACGPLADVRHAIMQGCAGCYHSWAHPFGDAGVAHQPTHADL